MDQRSSARSAGNSFFWFLQIAQIFAETDQRPSARSAGNSFFWFPQIAQIFAETDQCPFVYKKSFHKFPIFPRKINNPFNFKHPISKQKTLNPNQTPQPMLNLILFGPPGAGKGTQSEMLMSRYNLKYISTGELLRQELKAQSPIGLEAKKIIESGGLVDDEIIVQIIGNAIRSDNGHDGFLFDGFPRTYVQAYILDGLFTSLGTSLSKIFILDISDEECTKRLLQRAKEQSRSDDNEAVIKKRLEEYHKKTLPLLEFYSDTDKLACIDGIGTVNEVFDRINHHVVEEINRKPVNIMIFGYPGSGKTTQARKLSEEFNLTYISTSELLNNEVQAGGSLAGVITPYLEKGLLVPDEIVIRLIEKKLKETDGNSRGYVFKGYPRTLVQAYILDGIMKKKNIAINCVINLQVPHLELIKRLDARSRTPKRMPYDSSAATIVARLEEHAKRNDSVLSYYEKNGVLVHVNGEGCVNDVYERLKEPVIKTIRNLR
jgi:adenylate kinase